MSAVDSFDTHIVFDEHAGGVDGLDGGPLTDGDDVGDAGAVRLELAHAAAEGVGARDGCVEKKDNFFIIFKSYYLHTSK